MTMGDAVSGLRIGHGYDAHRLVSGRKLILGGVTIPYAKGLSGHSDADALLHAVCDAILGAGALGDIGQHFPDTQEEYRNLDSRILLRRVRLLLERQSCTVVNLDITLLAEAPRLASYLPSMRANLVSDLGIPKGNVNIKATTTEGMGALGRGEGIAVHAVVLVMARGMEQSS